jgi:nicotinamide-nucleotide amidase
VPEAEVAEKVDDLLRLKPPVTMGIYARPAEVELKIMAKGSSRRAVLGKISRLERTVRGRLKGFSVFGGEETLEERLGKLLRKQKKSLAAAESCTGGYLGQLVTSVSGASDYFAGSITAYQNRVKTRELGVSEALLRKKGAVSAECAGAMAEGVRRRLGSDLGVSITGIAGPTGSSPTKPVGLVYVGLSDRSTRRIRQYFFIGKREEIRFKAARSALLLLIEHLERRLEPESPKTLKNQVRI